MCIRRRLHGRWWRFILSRQWYRDRRRPKLLSLRRRRLRRRLPLLCRSQLHGRGLRLSAARVKCAIHGGVARCPRVALKPHLIGAKLDNGTIKPAHDEPQAAA
jgi:hypothetical protein